jgi:hypothetical protein
MKKRDKHHHCALCGRFVGNKGFCAKCKDTLVKFTRDIPPHNCRQHDLDGGVCMICGSVTHRDEENQQRYDDMMWHAPDPDDDGSRYL